MCVSTGETTWRAYTKVHWSCPCPDLSAFLSFSRRPSCPSSFNFPSSSFSFLSFFYYEEVLTLFRGRLGVPQRVPSKLSFPPRHKVSCILKHPIVSTASCSLEELCECSLYVSCMYVFHSVGVSLPTCVKVSVQFINHSLLFCCCWNKIMNLYMLIFCLYFKISSNYTIIHSVLTIIIITSHRFLCWCEARAFSIDWIIIDGIFNRLSHMKPFIYFSFFSLLVCVCVGVCQCLQRYLAPKS